MLRRYVLVLIIISFDWFQWWWGDLFLSFLRNSHVFCYFIVPQAFKYLREEVKVFQGRPIMVSSATLMHFPDYQIYWKMLALCCNLLRLLPCQACVSLSCSHWRGLGHCVYRNLISRMFLLELMLTFHFWQLDCCFYHSVTFTFLCHWCNMSSFGLWVDF